MDRHAIEVQMTAQLEVVRLFRANDDEQGEQMASRVSRWLPARWIG